MPVSRYIGPISRYIVPVDRYIVPVDRYDVVPVESLGTYGILTPVCGVVPVAG